jgi:hypothetical protein
VSKKLTHALIVMPEDGAAAAAASAAAADAGDQGGDNGSGSGSGSSKQGSRPRKPRGTKAAAAAAMPPPASKAARLAVPAESRFTAYSHLVSNPLLPWWPSIQPDTKSTCLQCSAVNAHCLWLLEWFAGLCPDCPKSVFASVPHCAGPWQPRHL